MAARADAATLGRWSQRHPTMAIGGMLLGLVVLASLFAPVLTSYDPIKPSFSQRLSPPWGLGGTRAHLLGTDNLGRDILARLLYGGRVSLALAVAAVAIAKGQRVRMIRKPKPILRTMSAKACRRKADIAILR